MSNMWILFTGIIVFEILALYLLTEWSNNEKLYYIILGLLSYIAVGVCFAYLMKIVTDKKLAVVNGLWQVINLVLITMLGVLLYKDKLLWFQWLAIVLAIISMLLLSYGEHIQSKNGKVEKLI